jgi:4-hydroxy-3-methylbut-2-enyl diphosphate reductase
MGTVQEVRIAKRTGFCYGVREAIDKAKESASTGRVTHTLGQVVHNEGVIAELQRVGVQTVESLDDVDRGAAIVIRAHGVRPDVMARAEARGLDVIDGTCTWVIQEQKELMKLVEEGYTIVLLGTPRHPEVVGLLGFAPDAIVVDDEPEWEQIPRKKKMALISQSTQPPWKFEKLAAFMVGRSHELKIVNTVCPVTIRRQEDTLEAAGSVDLMVVVGGRSSANTKELTRLCEISGTPAIQIEGAKDLGDATDFHGAHVVGVTGGTSTPIEDLHAVARRVAPTRRSSRPPPWPPPRHRPAARLRCPPADRSSSTARHRLGRGFERHGRECAAGRRHRRAPECRQEHALQSDRRRADGDRRGSRPHDA